MDAMELVLLYDYYGELLTDRQKECFELRYHQDMSLGEIGEELNITRQGVHDNLSRAEMLLRNMEAKTGCVARDLRTRRTLDTVRSAASILAAHPDEQVTLLARKIASAIRELGE